MNSSDARETLAVRLVRLRYRWSIRQVFADLFLKTWMEPAIPFMVLVALLLYFAATVPNYASLYNIESLLREFGEFGFVAIAMALTLMSAGLDLSVGSMFALLNFVALFTFGVLGLPPLLACAITLVAGAFLGSLNGLFIGVLRTRPFLTTLVSFLVYRGIYDLLSVKYSTDITMADYDSSLWDWLGDGSIAGIPSSFVILAIGAIIGHILLSRSVLGWHLIAIGSSRRSARHAGISVARGLFLTYMTSGILCAIAGTFHAARLNSVGSQIGSGYEFLALAAAMIGGVSLAGGLGSIGRALIGGGIIFFLTNGLVQLGFSGATTTAVNGAILLLAIGIDSKWMKNRGKAIQKSYVNPTYVDFGLLPSTDPASGGPYAVNDKLSNAEAIGLDQIEGPEDIILDREGRLYAVDRRGRVYRFSGEKFQDMELFARTGGRPLGMAFDRDDNLIVCVSGMGLYGVRPDKTIFKLTDETNRSWRSIVDDSRLKLTDDLDIAPDGKIYFSEGTTRYDLGNWPVDGIEGRGSGRLVCYDPATRRTRTVVRNLLFCNGVCVTHDGQAVLFVETFANRMSRYWIDGPKRGQVEVLINNLPGAPDNINRASDGGYWLALVAMRAPVYDVAMRYPGFRMKMIKRLPRDEWLIQGMNNGCIVKLDAECRPVASYWDPGGKSHATLTSMREDRGYLYLGGLENNRIGRVRLAECDPRWISSVSYWGTNGKEIYRPAD